MQPDYVLEKLNDLGRCLDRIDRKLDHFDARLDVLAIRLDRVEQANARTKWFTRTGLAAIVAAAVAYIIDRLTKP